MGQTFPGGGLGRGGVGFMGGQQPQPQTQQRPAPPNQSPFANFANFSSGGVGWQSGGTQARPSPPASGGMSSHTPTGGGTPVHQVKSPSHPVPPPPLSKPTEGGDLFGNLLGSQGYTFTNAKDAGPKTMAEMKKKEMAKSMDPNKLKVNFKSIP